jgi:hypothetical protein
MTEKFNYVIARPWDEEDDELCCYMLCGNDVHYGTLEDAQDSLDYVLSQLEDEEPNDYRIYKVVPL